MNLWKRNPGLFYVGSMFLLLSATPAGAQTVPDIVASRAGPNSEHSAEREEISCVKKQSIVRSNGGDMLMSACQIGIQHRRAPWETQDWEPQDLIWITNMADRKTSHPEFPMPLRSGQTPHQAFMEQQRWLSGKIIGDPQPTYDYSVAQLKAMHIVGVYSNCSITASKTDRFGAVVFDTAQECNRKSINSP